MKHAFMKNIKLLAVAACTLCGCRDKESSAQVAKDTAKPTPQTYTSNLISQKANSTVVFDVPSLLRLSMLEVKKKLGPPNDELQANVTDTERSLVYDKKGLRLTINYFVRTNQIDNISLATINHDTTAYSYLEPIGNLRHQDTTYVIKPQEGEKAGQYHGLLITPNPPVEFPVEP
ncbi:hypothetical protein [Hymenobacter terrenus]|uniref:hypothetical protein n=1 Tax=Hymenobacter terrenus TaxID=1629124 RepID=UPI000B0FFD99|nr:hypothetical protein [Hymenobacter terrenus]